MCVCASRSPSPTSPSMISIRMIRRSKCKLKVVRWFDKICSCPSTESYFEVYSIGITCLIFSSGNISSINSSSEGSCRSSSDDENTIKGIIGINNGSLIGLSVRNSCLQSNRCISSSSSSRSSCKT